MMELSLMLISLVGLAVANPVLDSFRGVSTSFIKELNHIEKDWTAGKNFEEDLPREYFHTLVGTLFENEEDVLPSQRSYAESLPESYDPRISIPNCPSLKEVRDQARCGSCWSFGAVETMTDRTCISSNGTFNFHYSADDLLSCCRSCGYGCNGGYPHRAFKYWVNHGIVSGGPYGSTEGCRPYEKTICSNPFNIDCHSVTPECSRECIPEFEGEYEQDLHFGAKAYSVPNDEEAIKAELYLNGPIEAAYQVYEDFYAYKSGIYHHVAGDFTGGHAVKLIGYGVENGVPYWLLTNSWGESWGEDGFFRIRRGNECRIQERLVTGIPKL